MTLLAELLGGWQYTREGVIAEVENLPDMQFNQTPPGLQRSALDLANHIVESGRLMAGELSRVDADFLRKPYPELIAEHSKPGDTATNKAEAIRLLKRSHEEDSKQLADAGGERLLLQVRQFNAMPATRIIWMHHGIAHEEYHRGQLAMYARLFGVKPALTRLIEGG